MIDTSSSSPFVTRQLGAELAKLRLDLVDSPITQEQLHAIDTGGATLMVGADSPEVLEKVMPILKDMSTHVFPMGGLGAGHIMKTLNNYVSVGSIIALNDALVGVTIFIAGVMLIVPGYWSEAWPRPADNDRCHECWHWRQFLNQIFLQEPKVL